MTNDCLVIEGRCWIFPEANINTDLMMPSAAFMLPLEEQTSLVFQANRPGWAAQVVAGDVLVGGANFGTGSSRPAARVLKALGIAAVIVESMNSLFYRNCINYALPVLEVRGVLEKLTEGDIVACDMRHGTVDNRRTGDIIRGAPMLEFLQDIIRGGGITGKLKAAGYI